MLKVKCFFVYFFVSFFALAQTQEALISKGLKTYHDLFNTVNNPEVSCYRIPALLTANNGNLIAAIDERVPSCGDLKWSEDINIVIRRSTDNGNSWSTIERVIDFPLGQSASDPSLLLDSETGTIFMFYNFMDLRNAKDQYFFHVTQSEDNGKTWSKPKDITSQIAPKSWFKNFKFITSGRGTQTKSGILLHCLVNLEKGTHVFGSKDHGKSWFLINHPLVPGDESKIIELNNGDWMVNSRVSKLGSRYIHVSKDQGKTWQGKADSSLVDPACNASIIRYTSLANGDDKNRLLFANANSEKGRENMTVKISYDEGITWSNGKTIYSGSSAYSSLSILNNGDIGLFFEKDDYKKNVFVSFSLEWLTDGKDRYIKTD